MRVYIYNYIDIGHLGMVKGQKPSKGYSTRTSNLSIVGGDVIRSQHVWFNRSPCPGLCWKPLHRQKIKLEPKPNTFIASNAK